MSRGLGDVYKRQHPFRGSKNEPKYVLKIAEKIAELRGETLEQIALSTSKNAEQFFNI